MGTGNPEPALGLVLERALGVWRPREFGGWRVEEGMWKRKERISSRSCLGSTSDP